MQKIIGLLVLVSSLTGILAGCGVMPEPTAPPPTQTPWIIVVTATPGPGDVAQIQPTQTPRIVVATPTRAKRVTPSPTAVQETTPATVESATASLEASAEPRATTAPQTPTRPPAPADTPAPGALKYPPPVLLDPPTNRPVSWNSRVLLKWAPVGELAEDEYYHLHLERPPKTDVQQWYGDYVYRKDTEYLLEGAFLAPFHLPAEQGDAVVNWWVRVVRKIGEDDSGKPLGVDVSGHSEKRTLIIEPKPEN
jgi:hypothetical protein